MMKGYSSEQFQRSSVEGVQQRVLGAFATALYNEKPSWRSADALLRHFDERGTVAPFFTLRSIPAGDDASYARLATRVFRLPDCPEVRDAAIARAARDATSFLRDTLLMDHEYAVMLRERDSAMDYTALMRILHSASRDATTGNAQESALRHMRAMAFLKVFAATRMLHEGGKMDVEKQQYLNGRFRAFFTGDAPPFLRMVHSESGVSDGTLSYDECDAYREIVLENNQSVDVSFCMRTKSMHSALLKFFGKMQPTRSMDDVVAGATKDLVGARVTVPDASVQAVLEQMITVISAHKGALRGKIVIDGMVLDDDALQSHLDVAQNAYDGERNLELAAAHDNAISSGRFRVAKFVGTMRVDGEDIGVEFMVVPQTNRNEAGLSNHHVYDCAKTLRAVSVVLGGVPNALVRRIIDRAAERTDLYADTIRESLVQWPKQKSVDCEAIAQRIDDVALAQRVRDAAGIVTGLLATYVPTIASLRMAMGRIDMLSSLLRDLDAIGMGDDFLRTVLRQQATPILVSLPSGNAMITAGVARMYCDARDGDVQLYCDALRRPMTYVND